VIDFIGTLIGWILILAATNASVVVEIEGVKKTIREWITYRNVTAMQYRKTFQALNNNAAQAALSNNQGKLNLENGVQVKKLFKEEDKNAELAKIDSLTDRIDATLEIVNVTTDLI